MKQKMSRGFGLLVFLFGIFFGWDGYASAATYYLATNGNDSNSCIAAQSANSAKQTFSSAKGCLAAGDTLVIRDGTYSGTSNAFSGLPNGSVAGGYITIKAENEGSVIVTGGLTLDNGSQYLIFQGLRFQDANGHAILGNHIKLFRNEFKGGCASGNCAGTSVGTNDVNTTADILFEDNWFHGAGGRYNLLIYNSNRVIVRRAIIRHDGGWTDAKGDPEAGINFYNSSQSSVQNSIILDNTLTYHTWQGDFYMVYNSASPNATNNNSFLGDIALNDTQGFGLRFDGNGPLTGHIIQDFVALGTYGATFCSGSCSVNSSTFNRITLGNKVKNSSSYGMMQWGSGFSASITNTIITGVGSDFQGLFATYFDTYNNDNSVSSGTGRVTFSPFTNGLLYPIRIESGNALKTSGSSGGQIGAQITTKIGTSGTLYGDAGYNTDTGQTLWPFPNEARIKKEMCDDAGVTRGFCSDSSLTHYIMNYLGNGDPYSTPDTTPPTSPSGLAATSLSQSSISVSWTASTDNVAVTGYIVERCQGSGCSNFAQVGTPTASPFVDTGLTPNTIYNYHVRAVDGAGNLSGWSNVVGATTQTPDTTPPTAPSNLQTSVASSFAINLTWTASADNVAVTGYKVERCSGASCTNFTQIGTSPSNSYSDTGLSGNTIYRYHVRATDGTNDSSYSNVAGATTPETTPVSANLLLGLNFNEGFGTTTQDVSGHNHTGTLSNASWTTGRNGNSVSFSGNANSYVAIPNESDFDFTNNFTVSLWMKTASFGSAWASLVSKGDSSWSLTRYNTTSTLDFNTFSPSANDLQGTANVMNDAWHHVAIVYDGATKKIYVDGTVDAQASFTQTLSTNNFPVRIGGNAEYTAGAFNGSVDDIRIYNKALTQSEIQTDMNTPLTQPTSAVSCNTVTTANFSQSAYNNYGAPFDAFQTSTNLINTQCNSADTHTVNLTTGITGDTTRIVYTKGYWYDAITTAWRQYAGTCTGALNGEWCQGSVSVTITDQNVSVASAAAPTYLVGMTCSVQGGSWKCGCRDTSCTNFSWQIQGAGL